MPITENAPIRRFDRGEITEVEDVLVTEAKVAIELGGEELIRTTCSPGRMREWVIGYLFSEGHIVGPDDVAEIREVDGVFSVELADSAPLDPASLAPVPSDLTVDPERLLALAQEVAGRADAARDDRDARAGCRRRGGHGRVSGREQPEEYGAKDVS